MTAPVPVSSWTRYVGIAPEVTQGTPVTTPTYYFKPTAQPDFEILAGTLDDTGMRGAPVDVYGFVAGQKGTNYGWRGNVLPDTFPFPLVGVLGEIATTGASAPYTHTITANNTAPFQGGSYTLIDNYGANTRKIPGFMFDEVVMEFTSDGLLTYTTKGQGWSSSPVTPPARSYTALSPLAAVGITATIGGSASSLVLAGTVTMARPVKPIKVADGTQDPSVMWGGNVAMSGNLRLIMANDTELNRFENATSTSLVLDIATGAGASAVEVKVTMSSVQYTSGKPDFSNDWVELPVDFRANANTTDIGTSGGYSPCKWLIKNAVASGAYR